MRSEIAWARPLNRAVAGAFYYGLSFKECDSVFRLMPGESERTVRCVMLMQRYSPCPRQARGRKAGKRGGAK